MGNERWSRKLLVLMVCGLIFNAPLTLLFSSPAMAELSAQEAEVAAWIAAEENSALELLQRSVDINSGTMNFAGVREVGAIFAQELQALGFTTQWLDGAAFNRAGHLLASYGTQGPKILLLGHLDTVFTAESPLQRYEPLGDGQARGPGVIDMKGGNVVLLQALKALKAAGMLDRFSFQVLLTGDEEDRGAPLELAVAPLIEAGRWAEIAIGFESGDGNPATAVISRRGATTWTLSVTGRAAHSSQIFQPQVGDGAIFEAARILHSFRLRLSRMPNLTLNPGLIVGGTNAQTSLEETQGDAAGKANVVAQKVLVTGDLRVLAPQQLQQAQEEMQRILAQNLRHASAVLEFDPGYPPMAASKGNNNLLNLYSAVSEDLGQGKVSAVNPRNAGAADISFVAAEVEMAIDGLGLMGRGGHTDHETADLATLVPQAQRAAVLLLRLQQ